MRRRFFVEQVRNGQAEISGEDAQHLTRVLRVEAGQHYEISDNHEVYLAEIETARKERVVFRTVAKLETVEPPVRMILCASLIKFDHFEWMIEKATEMGAERVIPVIAIRTEKGLEKAAGKRVERWRRLGVEASQQSRRARLPVIEQPLKWRQALSTNAAYRFALDENPGAPPFLSALPKFRAAGDTVALLTGPEGGWTDGERAEFSANGWTAVSLGTSILRAETAALAGLAVVSAAWQQLPADKLED